MNSLINKWWPILIYGQTESDIAELFGTESEPKQFAIDMAETLQRQQEHLTVFGDMTFSTAHSFVNIAKESLNKK